MSDDKNSFRKTVKKQSNNSNRPLKRKKKKR